MTAAAQPKSNEPGQAALDAYNLARIRTGMVEADGANEANNSAKNKLRGVFAQTQAQGLNNDAARTALRLVKGGAESIDEYLEQLSKVQIYIGYLGYTLSKRQYELFGIANMGPTPEDERAAIEGRAAGFATDDEEGSTEKSNPYETGSIKGQAWLSAFRQARSERDAILAMPQPEPAAGGEAKPDGAEGGDSEEGKA